MKVRARRLSGVRKIAVLRANGIGDLMFGLPALQALRSTYPDAEITLLAADWHRAFLEGRPGPVDRVVAVPPSRGVREDTGRAEDPLELDAFFERMRGERFDLAVQIHGGGRHSNPFVRRLGARVTVGLQDSDAAPLDLTLPYVYFQPEIARYLEVVSLVGATTDVIDPHIAVTERDLEESLAVVGGTDARFVVMNPSAGDPRRRWPAARFARVARGLRAFGFQVNVVGVDRDREVVREVVAGMGGSQSHDLSGRLSLNGLAGLLSRAALVVSNDSGPLHLAAAVGAATVGIYWCGNAITAAPITRARHRPAISWTLQCPRCGAPAFRNTCGHHDSFVGDVAAEEVLRLAQELLGAARETERHEVQGAFECLETETRDSGRDTAPST